MGAEIKELSLAFIYVHNEKTVTVGRGKSCNAVENLLVINPVYEFDSEVIGDDVDIFQKRKKIVMQCEKHAMVNPGTFCSIKDNVDDDNCRGLGNSTIILALYELIRVWKPTVIFLFETLSRNNKIEELQVYLNYDNAFVVDCVGHSGGFYVLWKSVINCTLMNYSRNHIDLLITGEKGEWRLTGDFNDLLSDSEKSGESTIQICFYRDSNIRYLILDRFTHTRLFNLVASTSDHNPIMMDTTPVFLHWRGRHFKFENKWFHDPNLRNGLGSHVSASWFRNNRDLEAENDRLRRFQDSQSIRWFERAKKELAMLLLKERDHWKQRAKQFWLKCGLLAADGFWVSQQQEIDEVVRLYFEELFMASESIMDIKAVTSNIIFRHLRERLWGKLNSWQGRKISKAGNSIEIGYSSSSCFQYEYFSFACHFS
ncbi:hypothetical protein ACS0TY_011181 [Phlomoides rotata]